MPELRLTLLVVGLIFLAGLTWWELRRPHQARGGGLPRPAPEPQDASPDWDVARPSALSRARVSDAALDLPRMSAHDPTGELPIVEVDPDDFADLEAHAQEDGRARPPRAPEVAEVAEVAEVTEVADAAAAVEAPEATAAPDLPDAGEPDAWVAELFSEVPTPAAEHPLREAAAPSLEPPVADGVDDLLTEIGSGQRSDPPISELTVTEAPQESAAPEPQPEPEPAPAIVSQLTRPAEPPEPVVDWPAPEASQVFAVRLISGPERFSGRAVRQALAAEGFVLGKFAIFHKPGPDGRALLSIASLNKPGTFEAHTIDMHRFAGLNLFAVLPGPLPGPATVDELLASAQVLAQRLHGTLRDDQGEPLTASRTAVMRSLAAAAPT